MIDQAGNWDEFRTAYHVARLGTVSGAAQVLGVHHATVIRHIDALEARLGAKLFQRHPRGYSPTEAGQDLLQVAAATEEQLSQLAGRIRGQGGVVSGELIVTAIGGVEEYVMPALARFQEAHPAITMHYVTDSRLFRLEYGEAHLAIRAGNRPTEPDNVVQKFLDIEIGLFASVGYVERFGRPTAVDEFGKHRFVATSRRGGLAPFEQWFDKNVSDECIAMHGSGFTSTIFAIRVGTGIGFADRNVALQDAALIEVMPPKSEWNPQLWLVTHVDLHRTTKVQAALSFLKQEIVK